jgi:hypothetical protein
LPSNEIFYCKEIAIGRQMFVNADRARLWANHCEVRAVGGSRAHESLRIAAI